MSDKKIDYGLEIVKALKLISEIPDNKLADSASNPLISYLYQPDERLPVLLNDLKKKIIISKLPIDKRPKNHHNEIGKVLEQIAYLSFKNIEGVTSIKSFQSAGPQYDLLVSGDTLHWKALCELLFVNFGCRDFLIEAKATTKKVDDKQFARMCNLLDLNLFKTGGFGIFFTLNGATGFPKKEDRGRLRSLRDSRLRQVMYLTSKKKAIVVLDINDICKLVHPGSLIKILINKVREISYLSGKYSVSEISEPVEKDLPDHLLFPE